MDFGRICRWPHILGTLSSKVLLITNGSRTQNPSMYSNDKLRTEQHADVQLVHSMSAMSVPALPLERKNSWDWPFLRAKKVSLRGEVAGGLFSLHSKHGLWAHVDQGAWRHLLCMLSALNHKLLYDKTQAYLVPTGCELNKGAQERSVNITIYVSI